MAEGYEGGDGGYGEDNFDAGYGEENFDEVEAEEVNFDAEQDVGGDGVGAGAEGQDEDMDGFVESGHGVSSLVLRGMFIRNLQTDRTQPRSLSHIRVIHRCGQEARQNRMPSV